ncbi:MAG TPA: tetratricopeptide repeat protein [Candidatus Acidoferrales bacterium]|nr:tetratricopeptide repeat protein [Candidatus Acidoferrales bacterium]
MSHEQIERAWKLIEQAYRDQIDGELDHAVELYKDSLQVFPTAEAHTYLGWTYHLQGRVRDAIDECKRAIEIDPNFGNPYNDIGAYLISLGRHDEAIPWLEHAIQASRYEPRHYPYFNLGRIYYAKGMINRARQYFQEALRIDPGYAAARQAVENIRRMLN